MPSSTSSAESAAVSSRANHDELGTRKDSGSSRDEPQVALAVIAFFYLLAFFSGFAALIYEITWAKMLALTFGSTTLSAAAVIAGFMGGMGLGARWYHLLYDRFKRPLLLYGCLEIGIALITALLSITFYSLPSLIAQMTSSLPMGFGLSCFRFVTVFLLILPAAALMGATFPALCTIMIRTARGVDRHLGMIYGINTIGAAVGVLFAGLFLIEQLGLRGSVFVGNAINVVIGCAALALIPTMFGRRFAHPPASDQQTAIPTMLPRWLTGLVLFVSGFATLGYEILWFRALHYIVGNSTYAITAILCIFLVGLGIGSLGLRRVTKSSFPEAALALCQMAIAVLAVGAMACLWWGLRQPDIHNYVSIFSERVRAQPWAWRIVVDAALAVVVVLPATLFMGLSFPLASRLYLGDVRRLGKGIGSAYLFANLGGILGAILGATLLLPWLGTIGGTKALAGLSLLLGVLVLGFMGRRAFAWAVWVIPTFVIVGGAAWLLPASVPLVGEKLGRTDGILTFMEEGDLATVQVLQNPDNPAKLVMEIDGCKIGWSGGFRGSAPHLKEIILAHLPMVLYDHIRQTLCIGLGSAVTLKTLAGYPEIETMDCVEINRAVVRASLQFEESQVLSDPRVHLIVDDAIHYLLRTQASYDLIISDGKQDPFFSGNATLLCREYYQNAFARLKDSGLFTQWITLGSLNQDFQVILRTICQVFPYVQVYYIPKWSVIMVASNKPIVGRERMDQQRFDSLSLRHDLEPYHLDRPVAVLSHRVAGRSELLRILGDAPISTWDRLLLDFSAYKAPALLRFEGKLKNIKMLLAADEASLAKQKASQQDPTTQAYIRSSHLIRRAYAAYFKSTLLDARLLAGQATEVNPSDREASATVKMMDALLMMPPKTIRP